MFDLRYHVASLAAVFVALLIGILVGVAMSGKVDDAEKQSLQSDVNRLEAQLDAASERPCKRHPRADGIPACSSRTRIRRSIADRLADKRIAIVFVGPVDAGRQAATSSGRSPTPARALPCGSARSRFRSTRANSTAQLDGDLAAVQDRVSTISAASSRASSWTAATRPPGTRSRRTRRGEGREASAARRTESSSRAPFEPQQGDTTRRSSKGFYAGLGDVDVPTIGVEPSGVSRVSGPASGARTGLSTVDDIETPAGRLALALLLAGELDRELRPQGHRRRRDRSADRGASRVS